MTYILFSIPGLAILIAVLILNIKGKCSVRIMRSMSAMLVVVALSMLCYAQSYNAGLAARYSWGFDFIYRFITPFCAPLYYLFVNCLTDIKRRPVINVLMFLPAIIYGVFLISVQLVLTGPERHAYICNEILGQNIQMEASAAYNWMVMVGKSFFNVFMPAQGILVMIYGEFRLNTYIKILDEYATNYKTGKTMKMRGIHVLTILIVVTGLIMSSIPIYESDNQIVLISIAVIGQCVMVWLIVHYVMQLELSAEDIHVMTEEPERTISLTQTQKPIETVRTPLPVPHREPVYNEDSQLTLIERIDSVMEKEKLYLNADLSIVSLSEKIGTNRTYVSKAIKDAKGCNFSDYVNQYRLEYAVEIMKQTPKEEMVVQNIALQCGFGSLQTFYRYFKLFFNETPSQWVERNK